MHTNLTQTATNYYARRTHAYAETSQYIESTHGCYITIKIYAEVTIEETRNGYKYDLHTPAVLRVFINSLSILSQDGFNPFQSNFSATRILPSSYLFWAGKRFVDYL
jgi:hypothetical protein